MTTNLNHDLRIAVAEGRTAALEAGNHSFQAASPEVEVKLSRLLTVTIGMFATAVTSVCVVGVVLF
ncbi:MAG: hypothetical protein AAGI48_17375 [Verrucomicrobiota bacterium]